MDKYILICHILNFPLKKTHIQYFKVNFALLQFLYGWLNTELSVDFDSFGDLNEQILFRSQIDVDRGKRPG